MSFQVDRIESRIVEYPLRQERIITTHLGRHDKSRYLVVTVADDEGHCGFGEATTVLMWSGEAAETAQWILENTIVPRLLGHRFDHPKEPLQLLDNTVYGHPFLKASLDTAVWDLWAKSQGVPVSKLIGDREPVSSVPGRFGIGINSTEKTVQLAVGGWNAGARTLKFKTGVPPFDDVERLRAVRERLGEEPIIMIDANGAYQTEDDAVAAIEALLPFNLSLVEQPTPRDRLGMLARVRKRVPVPILADESIFTPGQLAEAIDCDAFDLLSLYPGKNGGFTHSLEMAKMSQEAGKPCVIGSNMETDLGQAAMLCLAASLTVFPVEQYASDLLTSLFYKESSTNPPISLQDGRAQTPQGVGFGVEPVHEHAADC